MVNIQVKVNPTFQEVGKKFRNVDVKKASQEGIAELALLTERFSKIASPIDTGRMRSSISTDIGNLQAKISPHVEYAIYVHEGTRYMKARPFLSIGYSQAEMKMFSGKSPFQAHLERELDDKLK